MPYKEARYPPARDRFPPPEENSTLAYAEGLADEKADTAVAFLQRAIAFYARYGTAVKRPLTDDGAAYRSTAHAIACRQLATPPRNNI